MKHLGSLFFGSVSPSRPSVLRPDDWRDSVTTWGHAECRKAFGTNVARVSSVENNMNKATMSLLDFLNYAGQDDDQRYDTATLTVSKDMLSILPYPVPPIEIENLYEGWHEKLGLDLTWLIVGFKGAFNPLHTDIWSTSTWNFLLSGKKEWTIVDQAGGPEILWTQTPGEVIHLPSGWAHSVLYTNNSVAITENYVQPELAHMVVEHQIQEGLNGLSSFTQKLAREFERINAAT